MNQHRVNNQIRAPEVRVIGSKGEQLGVMQRDDALRLAYSQNLDLVEVAQKTNPPVAKIMDFGKFLYHQSKAQRKQKLVKIETKGVRISPRISEHDLLVKMKQAKKFLEQGHKVRIEMMLRGREKAHKDLARQKIEQFLTQFPISIKLEQPIKSEPRGLSALISKEK